MAELLNSHQSKSKTQEILNLISNDLKYYTAPMCYICKSPTRLDKVCIDKKCPEKYYQLICETCQNNTKQLKHKKEKHQVCDLKKLIKEITKDIQKNHNTGDIDFDVKKILDFTKSYNKFGLESLNKQKQVFQDLQKKCNEAIKYVENIIFYYQVIQQGKNPYKYHAINLCQKLLKSGDNQAQELVKQLGNVTKVDKSEKINRMALKNFSLDDFTHTISNLNNKMSVIKKQIDSIDFDSIDLSKVIARKLKSQSPSKSLDKKKGYHFHYQDPLGEHARERSELKTTDIKDLINEQRKITEQKIQLAEAQQKNRELQNNNNQYNPNKMSKKQIKQQKQLEQEVQRLKDKAEQEKKDRKNLQNAKFNTEEVLKHVIKSGKKAAPKKRKQFKPKYKELEYDEMESDDEPQHILAKVKNNKLNNLIGKTRMLTDKQKQLLEKQMKLNKTKKEKLLRNTYQRDRSVSPQTNKKQFQPYTHHSQERDNSIKDYNFVPEYLNLQGDIYRSLSKKNKRSPLRSTCKSAGSSGSPRRTKDESAWNKLQKNLYQQLARQQKVYDAERIKMGKQRLLEDKIYYESVRMKLMKQIEHIKEDAINRANAHGSHAGKYTYWRTWYQFTDPAIWNVEGGHQYFPKCYACKKIKTEAYLKVQSLEYKLDQVRQALRHLKSVQLKPRVDTLPEKQGKYKYKRNIDYNEITDDEYKKLGLEDFSKYRDPDLDQDDYHHHQHQKRQGKPAPSPPPPVNHHRGHSSDSSGYHYLANYHDPHKSGHFVDGYHNNTHINHNHYNSDLKPKKKPSPKKHSHSKSPKKYSHHSHHHSHHTISPPKQKKKSVSPPNSKNNTTKKYQQPKYVQPVTTHMPNTPPRFISSLPTVSSRDDNYPPYQGEELQKPETVYINHPTKHYPTNSMPAQKVQSPPKYPSTQPITHQKFPPHHPPTGTTYYGPGPMTFGQIPPQMHLHHNSSPPINISQSPIHRGTTTNPMPYHFDSYGGPRQYSPPQNSHTLNHHNSQGSFGYQTDHLYQHIPPSSRPVY